MNVIVLFVLFVVLFVLCIEQEVICLVYDFYVCVCEEEWLGFVFEVYVYDWLEYLVQLVDFWLVMLCGMCCFKGLFMFKYMVIELDKDLFDCWLVLFWIIIVECGNLFMQVLVNDVVVCIGDIFWKCYQMLCWLQVGLLVLGIFVCD